MTPELIELPAGCDLFFSSLAGVGLDGRSVPRYTVDGRQELEDWLDRLCGKVRQDVQALMPARRLEAVLLGGGYGRGEGGVLRVGSEDRPYNDLDYYVCLRGRSLPSDRSYQTALDALGHLLSTSAGVEVEFKIMSLARLRRQPVSMFSYDLVAGHRWLLGGEHLLKDCGRHRHAEDIPLAEATRLLMNRCSGLLFARERLQHDEFTPEDADFVNRNIAKTQLACGDVVLVTHRQYHSSCRERQRRLLRLEPREVLPWLAAVRRHHAQGVRFKLRPILPTATRRELGSRLDELSALAREVWLWVESRRLKRAFTSVRGYALSQGNKYPETKPWRNCLLTALRLGPRALLSGRAARHPRERLFHALPLLLWEAPLPPGQDWLHAVQAELLTTAQESPGLIHAYRSLWRQFR